MRRTSRRVSRLVLLSACALIASTVLAVPTPVAASMATGSAAVAGFTVTPLGCAESDSAADLPADFEVSRSGYTGLAASSQWYSEQQRVAKYDLTSNPPTVSGSTSAVRGDAVSMHPNRVTGYTANRSQNRVQVVDLSSAVPVQINAFDVQNVTDVQVSPDGRYLYVVNSRLDLVNRPWTNAYLRVYSLAASVRYPKRIASLLLPESARAIAVAPQGKSVSITTDDNQVQIVRLANPEEPEIVAAVLFAGQSLTYGRDGRQLFVGGLTARYATIDVATRTIASTRTIRQAGRDLVTDIEVSPGNKLVYLTTATKDVSSNSFFAIGIRSGKAHHLARVGYPLSISVSTAGPSSGRIYLGGLRDGGGSFLCAFKQSPAD